VTSELETYATCGDPRWRSRLFSMRRILRLAGNYILEKGLIGPPAFSVPGMRDKIKATAAVVANDNAPPKKISAPALTGPLMIKAARMAALAFLAIVTGLAAAPSSAMCADQPKSGFRQPEPPAEVYNAILRGGPVVRGTIVAITQPTASSQGGMLTFAVREQLRGPPVPQLLTLPYQPQPGSPPAKRPLWLWEHMTAAAGKNLLVVLAQNKGSWEAAGLLDLDGDEAGALPQVRRVLELEKDAEGRQKGPLLDAVSDSSLFVRGAAIEFLTARVCPADAACRAALLDAVAKVAQNPQSDQRVWAIDIIGSKVYAGFHAGDDVDAKAALVLAGLLADPDSATRGEAVQFVHGLLLGGGSVRPEIHLSGALKGEVMARLRHDAGSSLAFAVQAGELAKALENGVEMNR
jgi:hypothetical protein